MRLAKQGGMLSRWSLVSLALVAACGASMTGLSPRIHPTVTESDRRARLAAGAIEVGSGTGAQERARLRRIAELDARLGSRDEAISATYLIVDSARLELALARAGRGDLAVAQAAWDEASSFALGLARDLHEPSLFMRAVDPAHVPAALLADFVEAASHPGVWTPERRTAAWAALAGQPAARARLERSWGGGADAPRLTVAELRALGPSVQDLLQARLLAAASDGDDQAAHEATDALLAVDAWNLHGRLAAAWFADVNARRLDARAVALVDVIGIRDPLAAATRLERGLRKYPHAASLRLALAARYFWFELHADLRATVAPLAAAGASGQVAETARQLDALALLGAGDLRGYVAWADQEGRAAASVYLIEEEISRGRTDGASAALVARGRAAERRAFAGDLPVQQATWWLPRYIVVDADAPRALRERALARLRASEDTLEVAAAEDCLARRLSTSECEDRIALASAALGEDDDDEEGGDAEEGNGQDRRVHAILALGEQLELPPQVLDNAFAFDRDQLLELRPLLQRVENSSLALSQSYVVARVLAEIAAGDAAAATRAFERGAALLRPGHRLGLRLGLADLRAGADVSEIIAAITFLGSVAWNDRSNGMSDAADADALAQVSKSWPGHAQVQAFERGLAYWRLGARDRAVAELTPLMSSVDGEEGAELAALIAVGARAQSDAVLVGRASARAVTLAPRATGTIYLRAPTADTDGDHGAAEAALAELLAREPDDTGLYRDYLRELARLHPGKDGARAVSAFVATLPELRGDWRFLRASLADGTLATGADVADALAAESDADKALAAGARFQRIDEVALTVAQRAQDRLARSDANGLRDEARRFATYLEGTHVVGEQRMLLAWLWFLAGDGERALNAATRATSPPRLNQWGTLVADHGPLAPSDYVRALAPLRGRIPDPLAFELFEASEAHGDAAAAARALLALAPNEFGAQVAACRLFSQASQVDDTLSTCTRAFSHPSADATVAVDLTWALASLDDASARARGPDLDRFAAEARRRITADDGNSWLHNLAVVFEKRDRARDAIDIELEAWARGFVPGEYALAAVTMEEDPQAARLQESVRLYGTRLHHHHLIGLSALRSGDVTVARFHERAARAWLSGDSSDEERGGLAALTDLLELAEADLAARSIDVAGVRRTFHILQDKGKLAEWEALARQWPGSSLVGLLHAEALTSGSRASESATLLEALLQRFPANVTVAGDYYASLVLQRRYSDARQLLATLRRTHPDDARMNEWKVPDAEDGGVGKVPDVVATQAAFAERLARLSADDLIALVPTRRALVSNALEVFLPADWTLGNEEYLSASHGSMRVGVVAEPRAARCEGQACIDPIIQMMGKSGFSAQWTAAVELPGGSAYETMLVGPGVVMWMATVPAGAHNFAIFAAAPVAQLDDALPLFQLLRLSFRPLDRLVSAGAAEKLRQGAAKLADVDRWRARVEAAQASAQAAPAASACPLPQALAGAADDATRGALLLDAVLAARDAPARRALQACARPEAAPAATLALVALLDEDTRAHAWGRAAVAAAPARVRADAERVLLDDDGVALSSRTDEDLLPPFGVLEVLEALPAPERQAFAQTLAARKEPRWQKLSTLLPGLLPGVLDRAALRQAVRTEPAQAAMLAVWSLAEAPEDADIEVLRARLDAMTGPLDGPTRQLAFAIAATLAERLDEVDAPRFERIALQAEKVAAGEPAGLHRASARTLRDLGGKYARGRTLLAGKKLAGRVTGDDATVALWAARRARVRAARAVPVSDAMLAARPLATLVPGRGWTYARVAQPALFAASARDLGARARGTGDADTPVVKRLLDNFAERMVGHVFEAGAGLDLGRQIECASPGEGDSFVCVAYVKDREAVRSELARREPGSSSGVRAPLTLATEGFVLPLGLALLPAFVEAVISSMAGGEGEGDHQAKRLLVERARGLVDVAGRKLERLTTIELRDGKGNRYDGEVFLFAQDRLWLFSDAKLAGDVLGAAPARGTSLAEAPRFKALTRPWKDGGALQAVTMGASAWLDEEVAFEVAASADGVDFRVGGHVGGRLGDVGAVAAALPEGAASWFAIAQVPGDDAEGMLRSLGASDWNESGERGAAPPLWLAPVAAEEALGWYPEKGQPLWGRWIGAVGLDERVRKALGEHGIAVPAAGALVEHDGLTWALRGEVLVVGAPRALVEQALARPAAVPAAGGKPGARRVAIGHVEGARAAAALQALASGKRGGDEAASLFKMGALVVGTTHDVDLQAWQDQGGAYRLDARVHLNVGAATGDTKMVDQWLTSRALRNSARLPRTVGRAELAAPIVLEIEVDDAAATAARAFPASARMHVQIVDDRHLRIEVAPGPSLDEPVAPTPLGERERRQALHSGGMIVVDAPELRDLAVSIVPAGTAPGEAARRVVAWLQKNLRYEVTPEGLDALTILARGRGDCTEFSILAVSLLRAAGVPAELREGMALDGDELVAHAWVAFHDGTGWREIDPTFGVTFVDAGHLETEVLDFISLVSVDRLRITRVDAAKQ